MLPSQSITNHEAARPTRRLLVLGASGSVGSTTLRFIAANPDIELVGVSVHSAVDVLIGILRTLRPAFATISSEVVFDEKVAELRGLFPGVRFFRGEEGLEEIIAAAADAGCDTVLTAVVGACGIRATLAAVERGLKIALANKETLVTAGPVIADRIARLPVEQRPVVLPVDSEHNAIFQLLLGLPREHVRRLILTASGGPFRDLQAAALKEVTRAEVLNHPTWKMGPKISVDSAGMINKGLELIEARYLFGVDYDQLGVLIHKSSHVHGIVATVDGGFLLCASRPDMVFPVAHCLFYPAPVPAAHPSATEPETWEPLAFEPVSPDKYPGFAICRQAGMRGGTAPAILNAANEEAVALFLAGNIQFTEIPVLLEMVLDRMSIESGTELGLYLAADARARALTAESLTGLGA